MSDAAYAFLSVVRRGLAALVRPGLPPGAARVGVPVQFSVGGAPVTGLPQAALRGPGDVAGFDAALSAAPGRRRTRAAPSPATSRSPSLTRPTCPGGTPPTRPRGTGSPPGCA